MKKITIANKMLIICLVLLVILINVIPSNIFAARYDKENFPISYKSSEFPDSYQPYIQAIKKSHPNWILTAVYTGLEWEEALRHETYEVKNGISLVPDSYGSEWKKDGKNNYVDGNFVVASKDAVAYMMDPRNHLNEQEIFQFETLNFSSASHTKNAIEKVLYGTSMYQRSEYQNNGKLINMGKQYSDIILAASKQKNVSATFVASRIKQETGGDIIKNNSINGSFSGYEGYYNFFNIKATPPNAISNALAYAKTKGWTTPEKAITDGIDFLRKNWIDWGQYTTYFQKWDVNNEGNAIALYEYQYMTNIIAPTSESITTYQAYKKTDRLNDTFEFCIPVYKNMPGYAAPYPGVEYISDNTRIQAYKVWPSYLQVRSGPGTEYEVIAQFSEGTQMTRIAKSNKDQWDRVKLDDGRVGYVFRDYTKESEIVPVQGVSLNQTNIQILENETYDLVATINPSNANLKTVEWSSSNENVATVDQNGRVTAKGLGNTVITVTTKEGGKTATCNVEVTYVKVQGITLDKTEVLIKPNQTVQLKATITPENAKDKTIKWSSSNEDVATVDQNGIVTAKKDGNTVITAKSVDQGKEAICNITVENYIDPSSIQLNYNKKDIKLEENLKLIAKVLPENSKFKEVKWSSSNKDVAIVDENGLVTPKSLGTTTITVKSERYDISTTCIINVVVGVENISLSKTDYRLKKGEEIEVIPTITPDEALNKEYAVEIDDKNIIEYVNNKIIAKNSGETVIKFISKDNNTKSVSANVKVIDLNSGDIFIDNSLVVDSNDKYISKVVPGTKLLDFKDNILTNLNIKYYDKDGNKLNDNDNIGSGTKIVIDDGTNVIKEYTVIIYGDLSGDGEIDTLDLLLIQKYILEIKELDNIQLRAGNINKDGDVPSTLDLLLIQKHILNIKKIEQ